MPHIKQILNVINDEERCFYKSRDTSFINVTLKKSENAEYGLNSCANIEVFNSNIEQKYSLWNCFNLQVKNCNFTKDAIDNLWRSANAQIVISNIYGDCYLRYCRNLEIDSCIVFSNEFGWKSHSIICRNSKITGFCTFFDSESINIDNTDIYGERSLAETKNVVINNSYIDGNDSFWNCSNVRISNSIINSERFGWYSNSITLDNCKLLGNKPLCFSKNVRLIHCEFVDVQDAFEESDVNGNVHGSLISIKNPSSGNLVVQTVPKIDLKDEKSTFSLRTYRNH